MKRVCEKLGIRLESNTRPYQTIRELSKLRNFLAHSKAETYDYSIRVKEDDIPDMFRGLTIYEMVTSEKAAQALKDTQEVMESLHAKVKKENDDEYIPLHPLEFPLASASGVARRE